MDTRKRTIIIKWVLPVGGLFVVFVAFLIQFATVSYERAVINAKMQIEAVVDDYRDDVVGGIEYMTDIGKPVSYIMENFHESHNLFITELGKLLVQDSDAELVVYADAEGVGQDQYGRPVNLRVKRYFLPSARQYQVYSYKEADEVYEKASLVSAIPVLDDERMTGVLYMFYPMELIGDNYHSADICGIAQMMIMNGNGESLLGSGTSNCFQKGTDIYELLEETNNREISPSVRMGVREQDLRIMPLDEPIDGCSYLAMVPLLEKNDMFIALFFNESYVDGLIVEQWEATKYLVINGIVAFLTFLGVSIYILHRMNASYKVKHKTLKDKADKDLLTNVYNKITTEEKIKEYLANYQDQKGIFCLVDIDDFKNINDTRGHAFGDQVLKEIALRLESTFRATDIIGRIGGDEFLVFVKDLQADVPVEVEARKIESVFHDFSIGEYVKYSVTASIGISTFPVDGNEFMDLYQNADKAVYIAKRRGKNQAVVYEGNKSS